MNVRVVKRTFRLLGSGVALPGPPVSTAQLLSILHERFGVGLHRLVAREVAKRMGIETRHISRDLVQAIEAPRNGDTNPDLATRALGDALAEAQLTVNRLDYLFGHTTSPHTLLPPNISWVADRLGYEGPYVELRQACTGFANALQLAAGLLAEEHAGPVAIVGSEIGSVYFDPRRMCKDPEQLINLVQMGDGAGAAVLGPEDGGPGARVHTLFFGSLGTGFKPGFFLEHGGSGHPFCGGTVPSFQHDFVGVRENGLRLFEAGARAATQAGVCLSSIDWIVPHQANARLGELLAPLLQLPAEKFFVDADKVGNLGSASIWVALHHLRVSGKLKPGDNVLILGAEATKYLYGGFVYTHA